MKGYEFMYIFRLKREYENRVKKIRKWNKTKELNFLKGIKASCLILGGILSILIILSTIYFKNNIEQQL